MSISVEISEFPRKMRAGGDVCVYVCVWGGGVGEWGGGGVEEMGKENKENSEPT